MRRQRLRKTPVSVSLFPFLAVLICTMGALIVLLVLMVHLARANAQTIAEARMEEEHEAHARALRKRQQEVEDYQWRREVFQQQRDAMAARLGDQRLELSHLEDHIRRLEQRWKRLQAEATQLDRRDDAGQQGHRSIQAELARLQSEIQTERDKLSRLRELTAKRRRSFTIIPYRGPQGTRRRPIYIECTESGIIIQPEGVVLVPRDFAGPLGPGNPLDAALRTIREHWARLEGEARLGEPYPLLIVRPDGAVAYSMARAAMSAWDDEFGYELVDGDMALEFPPDDPVLKRLLEATVQTARQRQSLLAAAMPSRFDGQAGERFSMPQARDAGRRGATAATGLPGSGPTASGQPNGHRTAEQTGFAASAMRTRASRARQETAAMPSPASASASAQDASDDVTDGPPVEPGSGGGAALRSMALSRGANWALPNAAAGSTGITRPIAIQCFPDRLVILPDRGQLGRPQVFPANGALHEVIDEFIAGIWTHMQQWGMAVAGGYWKPVLKATVGLGAETRFRELKILLEDSGLEVERR